MRVNKHLLVLLMVSTLGLTAAAQTPVANRVKAVMKRLPTSAQVLAKYTDNERHSLYYIMHGRLYNYDVMTNSNKEVMFPEGYKSVLNTYLENGNNLIFIVLDRGSRSGNYIVDGKKLYMLNTYTKKLKEIGSGYAVGKSQVKGLPCFEIKKGERCVNTVEHTWKARSHYYDLTGESLFAGEEFTVQSSQ